MTTVRVTQRRMIKYNLLTRYWYLIIRHMTNIVKRMGQHVTLADTLNRYVCMNVIV